jgi:hypothetical protein
MEELHVLQVASNCSGTKRTRDGMLTQDELSMGPPRIRVKPNVPFDRHDAWGR